MTNSNPKKSKHPKLTMEKLKSLQEILSQKLHEIRGDVIGLKEEGLGNPASEGNNNPLHLAELGTDTYNQNFALGRLARKEEVLNQVLSALERIQTGEFGLCLECGGPLKIGRLEIAPWLPNCVECQEKLEM